MKRQTTLSRYVVTAALIAAAYAALTYLSAAFGIAYGNIQFRLSEALNVLAAFTPAAIPGLTLGCLLGNITSPFGIVDILIGTFATLLSAVSIRLLSRVAKNATPYLAILPPTLFNAVLVGLEITWFLPEGVTFLGFIVTAAEVAVGEIAVCGILGVPLYYVTKARLKSFFQ